MSGLNLAINIGSSNLQQNISGFAPEVLAEIVRQQEERTEEQKKLIAQLEAALDLNQRQVRAALDILNEKNIPPELLSSKLIEIAARFKALQGTNCISSARSELLGEREGGTARLEEAVAAYPRRWRKTRATGSARLGCEFWQSGGRDDADRGPHQR